MAAKKPVNLSELTFNELKDKAKEIEGFKAMNRFELLQAVKKANNQPVCPEAEKINPRQFKPGITAAKAKLAEATDEQLDTIGGMTPSKREDLRSAIRLLMPAQPKSEDEPQAEGETSRDDAGSDQ